ERHRSRSAQYGVDSSHRGQSVICQQPSPGGANQTSPALQRWVKQNSDLSPGGTTDFPHIRAECDRAKVSIQTFQCGPEGPLSTVKQNDPLGLHPTLRGVALGA